MNTAKRQVLECITGEILEIARSVFDENGLKNSSIWEHIEVRLEKEPDVVIRLLFDSYLDFIEKGRKPGSGEVPPISVLRDWALRKGLPITNDTLHAIASVIQRDGVEARPILTVIDSRLDKAFDERWADQLFESLISELTAFFD